VLAWVGILSAPALFVGTPGCEIGALTEVIHRARRDWRSDAAHVHSCPAGLHRLDAWESRQAWRRRAVDR
jgi:hypothetical protein